VARALQFTGWYGGFKMKLIRGLGIFVVLTALVSSTARADSVVVTPQANAPAPAAVPVPVQQPAPSVAVQPVQPVDTSPRKTVVTESRPQNYMATIAVSAFMGALAGALIGGAIYLLDDPRDNPQNIAYWAAGGVLVGTGIGLVNVMANESRANAAVSHRNADPVPTFKVALFKASF
jgi:hypothetical protein